MKLLLLGSGGREHALAWKLSQSPLCEKLYIAPGNAGTARCGTNVNLSPLDFEEIGKFCLEEGIGMVVVGPEEPLVKGIADFFGARDNLKTIPVIGPGSKGAMLEGSKAFAKKFMGKYGIPTASYREFSSENYDEGLEYLKSHSLPVVLKADGLAAGKGVLICNSTEEALEGYKEMLKEGKFGQAGSKVVIEQFLSGIELSVFVLTDGNAYAILPEAKDYKRIGEGDTGKNTGGMGAVSPVPFADAVFMQKVEAKIIRPTIEGLKAENIGYKGFIFFGLIKVGDEPYVIEYNCRMGDPETEVVMPRLKSDLVVLLQAVAEGKLDDHTIEKAEYAAATVMAVSGGYPDDYEKGFEISGLSQGDSQTIIFHAGTNHADGKIVTSGGRVLCVTSLRPGIQEAVATSVKVLEGISFEKMYYRRDIGYEFK